MSKKLYFKYGTVGSSKTLELLRVAFNYNQQGKNVILIKPKIDTRFGEKIIMTRVGLKREADILTDNNTDIFAEVSRILENTKINCILVDEVNFMSSTNIYGLRKIVTKLNIPVICYGLRTDYLGNLFQGSATLLGIADVIEEIKITCHFCESKATMNLKMENGKPVFNKSGKEESTNVIDLGCEEKYLPVCYKHFSN